MLSEEGFDLLFHQARTHSAWQAKPVSLDLLRNVYDTMKFGPTSANQSPLRILFLTSNEGKDRIIPAMMDLNKEKTRSAPVVAILAYDTKFYDQLGKLFPMRDIRGWFADSPDSGERAAFLNSTLQAAYFFLAARAHGLDCGPMTGFDAETLNNEFFPDGQWKATIVCNLGYGDPEKLFPRLPRLDFDEACRIL